MKRVFFALLSISIIFNISLLYILYTRKQTNREIVDFHPETFPYLSKRLFVSDPNDIVINFVPLREQIKSYINAHNAHIGLYFEYLPSGIAIGVNDTEEIPMASLIKVPTAIAMYKKIALGDIKLSDVLTVQSDDIDKTFGSLWKKGVGSKISVKEAIYLALTDSDNTAHAVLYRTLTDEEKYAAYAELDIRLEQKKDIYPVISAKSYSSILKNLYLSAYLPKEYSQELLEILTHVTETDRIAAPFNKQTPVAHKIGTYENINGEYIYSDCGIIYLPKRPYILCMIVQEPKEQAEKYMSDVSQMILVFLSEMK